MKQLFSPWQPGSQFVAPKHDCIANFNHQPNAQQTLKYHLFLVLIVIDFMI